MINGMFSSGRRFFLGGGTDFPLNEKFILCTDFKN